MDSTGYNGCGQIDFPLGLSNVVAICAGSDRSLFLTANGTGVTTASQGMSFVRAKIPARVPMLFQGCNMTYTLQFSETLSVPGWTTTNTLTISTPPGMPV